MRMRHVLQFCLIISIIGCNNSTEVDIVQTNSSMGRAIKAYHDDEKRSLDSISRYGLDSLYKLGLKYIYVIYGNEKLIDDTIHHSTVGENNIRIVGFESKSPTIKTIMYDVFINDSIPNVSTRISIGHIINYFDVDVAKKTILNASSDGIAYSPIENIRNLYYSALKSEHLKQYLDSHANTIHPKFKKIINHNFR